MNKVPIQRIELEAGPAPRLEMEQPLVVVPPVQRASRSLGPAMAGISILAGGFALLGAINFILNQFARSDVLGWATLAVSVSGFGLLGTGITRELRGLLALGRVDRLREALTSNELPRARKAARCWLARLPEGADILPAIDLADSADAIRALLRSGPVNTLRARTDALARTAALQSFAAASAVPSPSLDGVFVLWRGLRLIRQVAELYGLRPGTIGTLALLRRAIFSAAALVTTDVAINTALGAVTSHPLLRHIAGDVAGAGVAARRLFLAARATSAACSPLDPQA
jgi:uncharacterized membrane protein YcjF (UPF0283 family)